MGYVSHTDPRGKLPPWLVNKITQIFAPKMVKQLRKAVEGYNNWKVRQTNPDFKPWTYPEQMILAPRISITDVNKSLTRVLSLTRKLMIYLFFSVWNRIRLQPIH